MEKHVNFYTSNLGHHATNNTTAQIYRMGVHINIRAKNKTKLNKETSTHNPQTYIEKQED